MKCEVYYRNAIGKLLSFKITPPSRGGVLKDLTNQQALATHLSKRLGIAIMLPILIVIPQEG